MNINLIKDLNIQISSDYEDANSTVIQGYENIDNTIVGTGANDKYLKIHLLDNYKFDNLAMTLSMAADSYSIYYSKDNLNWTLISSGLTDLALSLSFTEIDASYIKISFINIDTVTISTITINSTVVCDDYTSYFKEYKKNEMKEFLPSKIYDDTDIKTVFDNYIEL